MRREERPVAAGGARRVVPVLIVPEASRARRTRQVNPGRVDAVSSRRLRQVAVLAILIMASLAASHEVIYLLAHGAGEEYARAMQEGGHDRYWSSFVLTVGAVTTVLIVTAMRQIRRLHRQTRLVQTGRMTVDDRSLGLLARLIVRLGLLVWAGTSIAFLVQENLETVSAGQSLPGLAIVNGERWMAMPVIAALSCFVALVGALVRWGRHVLLGRLRRAPASVRRAPRSLRPRSIARPASPSGVRSHGLRAPPAILTTFA